MSGHFFFIVFYCFFIVCQISDFYILVKWPWEKPHLHSKYKVFKDIIVFFIIIEIKIYLVFQQCMFQASALGEPFWSKSFCLLCKVFETDLIGRAIPTKIIRL